MSTHYLISRIYLVLGCNDHEASDPIRAFTSKKGAERFVDKWNKHRTKRPEPPTKIEDTPENHKLHDDWYKVLKSWEQRSPGGAHHCGHEHLTIHSMGLHE